MKSTRLFSGIPEKYFATLAALAVGTLVGYSGTLPLALTAIAGGALAAHYSPWGGTKPIEQTLNEAALYLGGWNRIFSVLGIAAFVSVLCIGDPAFALFDGAKSAASSGVGQYIGEAESTSLLDTLIFGLWALFVVACIAIIAGGVSQNVQMLVGGVIGFLSVSVVIALLEFSDRLLFT